MILANFLIPIILGSSPGAEATEVSNSAARSDFTDRTIELKEKHKGGKGRKKTFSYSVKKSPTIKKLPVQGIVKIMNDQLVMQGSIEPEDKSQRLTGFASRIKKSHYQGNAGIDYTNNNLGFSLGHAVTFEELSLTKAQNMFTYLIKDVDKFRAGLSYFKEIAGAKRADMAMESSPNALNVFLGTQLKKDLALMISFDNNQNVGASIGKSAIPPEFLTSDPYTRMAMLTSTNANGLNYAGAATYGQLTDEAEKFIGNTYKIGGYFGVGRLNLGGSTEVIDYTKIPVVLLPDGKELELPAIDFNKQSFRADALLRLVKNLYVGGHITSTKIIDTKGESSSTQCGVGAAYRFK